MMSALDGPHVGLGLCVGLAKDGHSVIEVQCTWTGPRKLTDDDVIITGHINSVMQESVNLVKDLVVERNREIAEHLGRKPEQLRLIKQTRYLHVHIENEYKAVNKSYLMGAIYISMISLLIGRRPKAGTAVFGDISPYGVFSSVWDWTDQEVGVCQSKGNRQVVVGSGTVLLDKAPQMVEAMQEDGQPLVKIIQEQDPIKMLSHFFG